MGYGAYMKVVNNRTAPLLLFVTDVDCMYDNGEDGSHLDWFNNAKVAAGGSVPADGGTTYIEAKGSGSCFFDDSTFTIKIEDADHQTIIGRVAFTDSSEHWNYKNDNEDVIDVDCNNSGDQAHITITVEQT